MDNNSAYQLGVFIGGLAPLAIGVAVSFHLRRKREQDHLPGWPIAIGAILTFVGCFGRTADASQINFSVADQRPGAEVDRPIVLLGRVDG
ncbi:hypothetical protein [Allosphingosinicella sp.]|jgi:hypothetical protein|uniref:hypothetical protein n=1 Tax=Allosphingosinicella sp. TaxID=2823234 RepID=UPI002F1B2101